MTTLVHGKHIIGGEIFYNCIKIDSSNGIRRITLKFTMNIYRDCASEGAALDEYAPVGIYEKFGENDYRIYSSEGWKLLSSDLLESNNPCIITPPSICVQKGVYEHIVELPISSRPYVLAYQRCCRNETISNINNPGNYGAAYTIEISPESQRLCNNSPRFKNFPPIIICNNTELNFDHSAVDQEGDFITYEFCAPYHAGGTRGSNGNGGMPTDCNGVTPSPGNCPPPFQTVIFKTPFYSFLEPLGGNPIVQINPLTGIITGSPQNQGQFVVGVCIKEYRNGVLLTIVRRDFQFNVTTCRKTVDAKIVSDSVQSNDRFIINACGDRTVNLSNISDATNIKTYDWEFDIDGQKQTFNKNNISITFPNLGQYSGFLFLNKGDVDCSDTASITINVFPGINANYTNVYDTCLAGPVQFTDLSTATQSNIVSWNYAMEKGVIISNKNPSYEFQTPGIKNVQLRILDNNGCRDSIIKQVNYYPVPALLVINPDVFNGCQPLDVLFNNLSYPIDSTYDVIWDFGDGTTINKISPRHTYDKEGIFSVSLKIKSPIGCETATSFPSWINVLKSPVADFDIDPTVLSNFDSKILVSDKSVNSEKLKYIINNKVIFERNPTFNFQDTGIYPITQIVSRSNGCADTLTKYVDIEPKVTYYMPNAFTPNGEGNNEYFFGVGRTEYMTNFSMSIWDRWGSLIYKTEDPNLGWNGRFDNTGDFLQPGVYIYTLQYNAPRNKEVSLKGYATLLR
ncbi:MAG: PKD domain-containing protein [Saprospiraceae bacterium]